VLTDTTRGPTDAARFVRWGVLGSLGFLGLLRLNWTELHVVLPFTRVQSGVAIAIFGTPRLPVEATLACSGADALALCLGAILAYPIRWRTRLAGAAGGAALIIGLNTLRIGSLGRAAASPAWFNTLHVFVWPAALTLAIAGYVFAWMRLADQPHERLLTPGAGSPAVTTRLALVPSRQFVVLTMVFLLAFVAASPLYLESPGILGMAALVVRGAAAILAGVGVTAHAADNVLWTSRGGFLVSQECITTPLIPIYLAAVCTYSATWPRRVLSVLAMPPLFIGLGILRLLVVALPDASPLFFVHAFYQLVLGAVVVALAAYWRYSGRPALGHALAGCLAGVLFVSLVGPIYTGVVTYPTGVPLDDPHGAMAFLPAFQASLYLALWVAAFITVDWRRLLAGLAALALTQTAGFVAMHVLTTHTGLTAHVRDVRGWAVAGPLLIVVAVVNVSRARR